MSNIEGTYSKHRYEINIVECAYCVVERMINERVSKVNIGQYAYHLKIAIQEYKRSINFDVNTSETARKQACVISPTHPAFNFWLALHLSIEDPDEISMLLDAYQNGDFGDLENFVGHVQYLVIRIMKANVFFGFRDQKLAVINWVSKNREKETKSKKEEKPQLNIYLEHYNLIKNDVIINLEIKNQIINIFKQFTFHQFNEFVNSNYINPDEDAIDSDTENPDKNLGDSNKNTILIPIKLTYDEVLNYFMQLTKLDNHEHIKSKDIVNLVKSNFRFKKIEASGKKNHLDVNIKKQFLNKFVYQLYKEDPEVYDEKATLYCQLLIDNFTKFKHDKIVNLKKNFSRGITGRYPFSIKK
ncbi:MAG: hypothetical protein RL762_451 [Bacteroidota bacterium]|jgi:hypothetical protein